MNSEKLWEPSTERVRDARLTRYAEWLARERGLRFADYDALWRWSTTELDAFWRSIWDHFELQSDAPFEHALTARAMPGARWFEGARLNYVRQVMRHASDADCAIVGDDELGRASELSWGALGRQVASMAHTLRGLGVAPGDRVVAYLPNVPQTIVAFLAVAAVGAVWSVCSPDMGPLSVLDRFRQIEPVVLIACDGYRYGGKAYDRSDVVRELLGALPTVRALVVVPTLVRDGLPAARHDAPVRDAPPPGLDAQAAMAPFSDARVDTLHWHDAVGADVPLQIESVAFDHPLWIVYSSGTTGLPKPIVAGHGGTTIVSLVSSLHNEVGPGDRYHWYSSTGWIMWNSHPGAMLAGATVCLYDGNPGHPDWHALWRFAARHRVTVFGGGAAFFASCLKAGIDPRDGADLSTLRVIGSTGSPLSPESYRWIIGHMGPDVWLNPISGGTDVGAAFVCGNVTLPIFEGEMQCRQLGMAVQAFDEAGQPVMDAVGELVCTEPWPSMPLHFWGDTDGARYHESYFDTYPGVWRHGDWIMLTTRPGAAGAIIYGRSDATINRLGIRMGTAELYSAVEALPEVVDSLVVDLEYLGRESYMPLFVVLREGLTLDDALVARIKGEIRTALSARHVPNDVLQVAAVPRTLSGKKMELPIRKLLMGQPVEKIANAGAMANPDSLAWFVDFAGRRASAEGRDA